VLEGLARSIDENEAEVTRDELPEVRGDPIQLQTLLQNLVSNAIKFHADDETPRVHATAEDVGEHWRIEVSDDGIGFDPECDEAVFGLFDRLHGPDQFEGTGVGLAVCRKAVEGHGGEIWAESKPGEGTTVHVQWPKEPERTSQQPVPGDP
jgi:light-regulated signal transduction histidine kinase (bacteriophytochrome)